jgi:hypothetical protein
VRDSLCSSDDVAEERRVVASETADRLRQALLSAEHADTQLAAVLDRVSTGGLAARSDTLAVAAAGGASDGGLGVRPAPLDGTPAEANAWWQSLSAEDQDAVLAQHPEWLGNTDGIPAGVRDRANRALIDVYRTELQAEAERLQAALDGNRFGGTFTNDDARLALVLSKIQGLDEIEIVIGRDNRQLLVLDIDGSRELMAAVAVGDVDSADHVAVFTPGLGTTVQKDLSRYDDSMRALWETARDESELYGDGGSVATVSWLGYEAPQMSKVYDLGGGSVVSPAAAEQGAVRLADFYRGVDASRSVDPHLTAVAHSYGSTTTGYALREQTGVDSAVIFGSPGMGISEIASSTSRKARFSGSRRATTSSRTCSASGSTPVTSVASKASQPRNRLSMVGRSPSPRGIPRTCEPTRRASTTSQPSSPARRSAWCATTGAASVTC